MAALDTNILLRYLINDDVAQSTMAAELIDKAVAQHDTLFIPITVVLELDWVLKKNYGFDKVSRVSVFNHLLSAPEFSIQYEEAVESALSLFQTDSADFADCLHLSIAHLMNELPLWTFDKKAAQMFGATLLN